MSKNPTKITGYIPVKNPAVNALIQYDCRPLLMQCNDIDKASLDDFIIDHQRINPNSECIWQLLLAIEYKDFELSEDH